AVVAGAVALLTARLHRGQAMPPATARAWWVAWLPTVVAGVVLAIPAVVLLATAVLRLARLIAAPLSPWRLDALTVDIGLDPLPLGDAVVTDIAVRATLTAIGIALTGVAVFGIARLALRAPGTVQAIVAGVTAIAVVAVVPTTLGRL